MANLVTDSIVAGIGFAVRATEQLEEIGRTLVEEGQLSKEAGSEFVSRLRGRTERLEQELRAEIDGRIDLALKRLGLARHEEMRALERRVAELEAKSAE